MAGVWNVNGVNDINAKRILRKLSFNIGESFTARVINSDKLTGEILLKLLDGWQFSAKLQNPMEMLPEGVLRFEVEGFEDGKLQLKLINTNNKDQNSEKESLDFLLKEKGITVNKEDYPLLSKMVKHKIPLTRENISNVKTLVDFQNKIKVNEEEEGIFISKYMLGKGIDPNSSEGNKVTDSLKRFFNQLKSISEDDIITLFENNVEFTEKNIKSFNDIFKGASSIYKDVKDIKERLAIFSSSNKEEYLMNKVNLINDNKEEQPINKTNVIDESKEGYSVNKVNAKTDEVVNDLSNSKSSAMVQNNDKQKNSTISAGDGKVKVVTDSNEDGNVNLPTKRNEKSGQIDRTAAGSGEKNDLILNRVVRREYNIEDIVKNIKEQISTKTEEIKTVIKTLLEQKNELKPESYNTLIQSLDKNISDFKVYNTISNQYYYMDLPINLENYEYQCKLMIKDERKKGKRIDSTDVKIAASVNTIHMGTVDAYIKVKSSSMEVDIKCDGQWARLLDMGKEKILGDLSHMGYNVHVTVDERQVEMNITNCRDFFEDSNLGRINVKV